MAVLVGDAQITASPSLGEDVSIGIGVCCVPLGDSGRVGGFVVGEGERETCWSNNEGATVGLTCSAGDILVTGVLSGGQASV